MRFVRPVTLAITILPLLAELVSAQCSTGSCPPRLAVTYAQASSPQLWQLTDATGQTWQHADPAYLMAFVASRNATLTPRATVQATPQSQPSGDPYGFGVWLNGERARYGLSPVSYDAGLSALASANSARGFGHHGGTNPGRQNVGIGSDHQVWPMWMASPPHRSALIDPGITTYGIAYVNGVWTYNAR